MKIKGIYKELQKEENYIKAYEEIKSKSGNMTPGIDKETLQGMSKEWIRETIKTIKDCSFKFKPSKRIYIPKKNGKLRPLGIPSPRDKIIQKIILNILTEYYEEKFQETSHGYRPGRSCKTALKEVRSWKGITWIIEGDIKSYFDTIDHHRLSEILKRDIEDSNFFDIYWKLVKAGYIERDTTEIIKGEKGVPQGGLLSPLLSNIYLNEMDKYIEELKKETNTEENHSNATESELAQKPTRSEEERTGIKENPERTEQKVERGTDQVTEGEVVRKRDIEKKYVRYADDFLVGIKGPKSKAEEVREQLREYLARELKIELNMEKTKITNITSKETPFLGYEITVSKENSKLKAWEEQRGIKLKIPTAKIIEKLENKGFLKGNSQNKGGKVQERYKGVK